MNPRTVRKARELEGRRRDILAAAERLFSKHGYFKTSMADIAEAAEFAIGTVYRFFKSKEEIYISLVEDKIDSYVRLVDERVAAAPAPTQKVEAVIRTKLEYFERNRDFFRIYVAEWAGFEWTVKSALGERVWKRYQAQLDLAAGLIREGIKAGEFRDVEPTEAAYALHGMLNSTIYLWILNAKPTTSLVSKSDSLASLFFHGAVPPAGRRRSSS